MKATQILERNMLFGVKEPISNSFKINIHN